MEENSIGDFVRSHLIVDMGNAGQSHGRAPARKNKGKSIIALPTDYIVIDTETTGLDYEFNDLIEICAVRYSAGQPIDKFSSLVQPPLSYCYDDESDDWKNQYVDPYITELTGITNDMLSTAPTIDQVIPDFLAFIGSALLIGHNVNFDINFLYDAAEKCGQVLSNDFIDTLRICRKVFPELKHHRLQDITNVFGLDNSEAHRAEPDCIATAQCYELVRKQILQNYSEAEFQKLFKKNHKKRSETLANITATVTEIDETNPVYGKVVVFTGALSCMERKDAFQIVVNLGGTPEDRITKKTNFLVIGNFDFVKSVKNGKSNKMKTAEDYQRKGCDIVVMSEDTFFDMVTEQLSFDDEISDERKAFKLIYPQLNDILDNAPMDSDVLLFKELNNCSSIYFLSPSSIFFQIRFRKNARYLLIPESYGVELPQNAPISKTKSDAGMIRIALDSPDDILKYTSALRDVLLALSNRNQEYGCCSRYEACSDAKACVHPDIKTALGCQYRKNLKAGKIFYGKNRNVE